MVFGNNCSAREGRPVYIEVKIKKFRVPTLVGRRETHSLPPKGGTLNTASFFFQKIIFFKSIDIG